MSTPFTEQQTVIDSTATLGDFTKSVVEKYLASTQECPSTNLYELVMSEVEEPLIRSCLKYTRGNQSKVALLLGINRGTLRKKMKKFNML